MNIRRIAFLTIMAAASGTISCSWSAEQQNILNSYNETTALIRENEWESATSQMTHSTKVFLDSLATELQNSGLQGYRSGAELLPVLCDEYIDFAGDVTMIFVQGDRAEITLSTAESNRYQLIREEGCWKLDLSGIFRDRLDTAFMGSYVW